MPNFTSLNPSLLLFPLPPPSQATNKFQAFNVLSHCSTNLQWVTRMCGCTPTPHTPRHKVVECGTGRSGGGSGELA